MSTGKFIVVEGPNFAGKSWLIREMLDYFTAQGRVAIQTREPGGTIFGEALRPILKGHDTKAGTFATALCFNAGRRQLGDEIIRPNMDQGALVFSDRYYMSTDIFQCTLAKDLTAAERAILREIHTTVIQPDLTLFVIPSAGVIAARVKQANRDSEQSGYADRYEGNPLERATYEAYATEFARHHPTLILRPMLANMNASLLPHVVDHPVFAQTPALAGVTA